MIPDETGTHDPGTLGHCSNQLRKLQGHPLHRAAVAPSIGAPLEVEGLT